MSNIERSLDSLNNDCSFVFGLHMLSLFVIGVYSGTCMCEGFKISRLVPTQLTLNTNHVNLRFVRLDALYSVGPDCVLFIHTYRYRTFYLVRFETKS